MSPQALYRVFRPRRFSDIKGQDAVVSVLKAQVASGNISHAYLFSGPRGNGKTSTARVFANAVNCSSPKAGEPCGECAFCRSVADGTCVDIIEIDAASNRGVEEIRDLRARIGYMPAMGSYRVHIIDEAHMLTTEAFNALLKTLEEPPAHVIFILATTEPARVPATVLSRCQRFELRRLAPGVVVSRISEVASELGANLAEGVDRIIAESCDGSLRDALGMLDKLMAARGADEITQEDTRVFLGSSQDRDMLRLTRAIFDADPSEALASVDCAISGGCDPSQVYDGLIRCLRSVLVSVCSDDAASILATGQEEVLTLRAAGGAASKEFILAAMGEASKSRRDSRHMPDPRFMLECCVVTLCDKEAVLENYTIKARLEKLEKRLEGLAGALARPGSAPAGPAPAGAGAGAPQQERPDLAQVLRTQKNPADPAYLEKIQEEIVSAGKYFQNKDRDQLVGSVLTDETRAMAFDDESGRLEISFSKAGEGMLSSFEKKDGFGRLSRLLTERMGRPVSVERRPPGRDSDAVPDILGAFEATQQMFGCSEFDESEGQ